MSIIFFSLFLLVFGKWRKGISICFRILLLIHDMDFEYATFLMSFHVQQIQVDVDKPLGLQLAQGDNGLKVKSASGNAAKAGISAGDTVIYASSFFGDELYVSAIEIKFIAD